METLRRVVVFEAPRFGPHFEASLATRLSDLAADGADLALLHNPTGAHGSLDPFVILASVAAQAPLRMGAAITLGAGRAASIAVREATALEHLSRAGGALGFVSEDPARLAQAMDVATALVRGEATTAGGTFEHIVAAPNRPGPRQAIWLVQWMGGAAHIDGELAELEVLDGVTFG